MAVVATTPETELPVADGFGYEDKEEGGAVQYLAPPKSRQIRVALSAILAAIVAASPSSMKPSKSPR
jgi:hypothetical protein